MPTGRPDARGSVVARSAGVVLFACGLSALGLGAWTLVSHTGPASHAGPASHGAQDQIPRGGAKLAAAAPGPIGRISGPAKRPKHDHVAEPEWLVIPAIGVFTTLVRLELTAQDALQVPPTAAVAGWYTGSPRPGQVGSSIVAGHIDSRLGPGVFYRLGDIRRGQYIYVIRANHTVAVFEVTAIRTYAKSSFPRNAVYGPVPDAELRLITCGGTFDFATGSYLSNVVVNAVLIR